MYPLNIVEDTADYLVVYKPRGIHSAPLSKSDGDSALSRIVTSYPEVGNVQGKNPVEGGLIHRIDKETEGLLLCAKNQDFYDYMDACQKKSVFFKEYIAVCDYIPRYSELMAGFPLCSKGDLFEREENGFLNIPVSKPMILKSFFRPYGPGRKAVRPVTSGSSKYAEKKKGDVLYVTECIPVMDDSLQSMKTAKSHAKISDVAHKDDEAISSHFDTAIFKARIYRGYRHQVRCHLAWVGYPVRGDVLYNPIALAKTDNTGKIYDEGETAIGTGHINQDSNKMNVGSGDFEMLFYAVALEFPLRDGSLKRIDLSSRVLQKLSCSL